MARSKGSAKGEKPRGRSGGGFRPPELRGTLGTLWRTTLQQAGVVRDVLERSAREGRSRLDEARTSRKRNDALAELGEIVLELIRNDEIDVAELPEAADLVAYLDELDGTSEEGREDIDVARPSARSRFDDRAAGDGTVSSSRWTPPKTAGAARVWRPNVDNDTPDPRDTTPTEPPPNRKRKGGIQFGNDDSDDDLKEYMHPDDVPPKPPKDGDGSTGP